MLTNKVDHLISTFSRSLSKQNKDMDVVHPDDKKQPLPASHKLEQPMPAGSVLHLHGKISMPASRVDVDFLEGYAGSQSGQTIFQISIHFDDNTLVMNSRLGGFWGKEEKLTSPFRQGMNFDLKVSVTNDCYEVYCGNIKYHTFNHRAPFAKINNIEVLGEATLIGLHFSEGSSVAVPHERKFTPCLQYNQHLVIFGVSTGDGFTIELTGNDGNALFQFNAKYKEKVITRNANIGGNWGTEERTGQFPFQRDRGFDLSLVNLPTGIQMIANNARWNTFAHRASAPISDYTGLKISGEVKIVMVRIAS